MRHFQVVENNNQSYYFQVSKTIDNSKKQIVENKILFSELSKTVLIIFKLSKTIKPDSNFQVVKNNVLFLQLLKTFFYLLGVKNYYINCRKLYIVYVQKVSCSKLFFYFSVVKNIILIFQVVKNFYHFSLIVKNYQYIF